MQRKFKRSSYRSQPKYLRSWKFTEDEIGVTLMLDSAPTMEVDKYGKETLSKRDVQSTHRESRLVHPKEG